jgi:uncharacterized protein
MVIALCGGLLTSTDTLSKWAKRMEYGVVRDQSVRTVDKIQVLGTMLGLSEISGRLRTRFRSLQGYSFATTTVKTPPPSLTVVTVKNHTVVPLSRAKSKSTKPSKPATDVKPRMLQIVHQSAVAQIWGALYEPILSHRVPAAIRNPVVKATAAKRLARIAPQNATSARAITKTNGLLGSLNQAPNIEHTDASRQTKQTATTEALTLDKVNGTKRPNVLIVGDSLMGGVGPRLKRLLRKEHGFPNPKLKWKASTGLSRPDYFDWPKTLDQLLSEKNYDVVVAIFGTNDTQPVSVNRKSYRYGTKSWFAHYRKRVVKVLDMMCQAQNRSVYWIGLPTMRSEAFNDKIIKMNALYREELSRSSCGKYIPMDKILSPDGQFSSYLRVGKKRKKVRAGDGIHLSFTGYDYVARRVIDTILAQTQTEFLQNEMVPTPLNRAL